MPNFDVEAYKKQLETSASCDTCQKVPSPKLEEDTRYIFISYSHKDYKKVYADLAELYASDIPFWYDEGLPAGKNWDDVVREKMTDPRCAGIIFFLSESLFLSRSIQTEIQIACGEDKATALPQTKRNYFSVNLENKLPSQIRKNIFSVKAFSDTEDESEAQLEWLATLTKAFPDKATFLPFDNPNHINNLVEQIGVVFGIEPNYNPYDFNIAMFRSGRGIIEFPNGAVYEGFYVNGLFFGHGKLLYSSGAVYEGEWVKGKRHGHGTMTNDEGFTYTGSWVDGLPNGKGIENGPDGAVYEGEWSEGKHHGHGTMTTAEGFTYTGDWADGLPHGKGRELRPDGSKYEGDWVESRPHGRGKEIRPDGSVYEGEWSEGRQNGYGTWTCLEGDAYTGQWQNGRRHGKGTYTFFDGTIHEGEWVRGLPEGQGKICYSDGAVYEGQWHAGKRHGLGVLILPDGTRQEGRFEDGEYTGEA